MSHTKQNPKSKSDEESLKKNQETHQILEENNQLKKELKTVLGVLEAASNREVETLLKLRQTERINLQREQTKEEQKRIIQEQGKLIHKLQDEKQLFSDQKLCRICYSEEIQVLPTPCGHLSSCRNCARKTPDCPFCRKRIDKLESVFWP